MCQSDTFDIPCQLITVVLIKCNKLLMCYYVWAVINTIALSFFVPYLRITAWALGILCINSDSRIKQ